MHHSLKDIKWFFNQLGFEQNNSFPPFNIVSADDLYNEIVIEIALAGYSKDEITITCDSDKLTVSGKKPEKESNIRYIARNIANRSFTKSFHIAKYQVSNCSFEDGMLNIQLQKDTIKDTKVIEIK